jgi:hypothetical protein
MATYGKIGSVSHATMREQDLIPRFIDELDRLKEELSLDQSIPELDRVKEVTRLDEVLRKIEAKIHKDGELLDDDADYWTSEDASYDLNEVLFEELGRFSPPFCSFGSHEGDGADYGWWWSMESFDEAVEEGTVLKVDDTEDVLSLAENGELADEVEYVAQVSDHGNIELYLLKRDGDKLELVSLLGIV